MRTNSITVLFAGILLVISLTLSTATASITPVGGTTSDPIAYVVYGSAIANVIDGVVNYNQWLALGQQMPGTFTGPYTVTFDLGAAYDLTGFNLWNNGGNIENDGEGVNGFTLTFYDASAATVGSFGSNAADLLAVQSFAFAASNVQTVDFTINSNHAPITRPYAIFYEVSFEGTPTPVVPVPGALLLAGIGLAGLTAYRTRVRNEQ